MKKIKTKLANHLSSLLVLFIDTESRLEDFSKEIQGIFPGIKVERDSSFDAGYGTYGFMQIIDFHSSITFSEKTRKKKFRHMSFKLHISGLIAIDFVYDGKSSIELEEFKTDFKIKCVDKASIDTESILAYSDQLIITQAEFERLLPKFVKFLTTGEI